MSDRLVIVGYDPKHAPRLIRRWRTAGRSQDRLTIVALDEELEESLSKENVPFVSGKSFFAQQFDRLVYAETWVRTLLATDSWNAYSYAKVPLLSIYAFPLQWYLFQVTYYVSLFVRVQKAMPDTSCWEVCVSPMHENPEAIVLTRNPSGVVWQVARFVFGSHGGKVKMLTELPVRSLGNWAYWTGVRVMQAAFGIAVGSLNTVMSILPRRPIRILASEYWKNIDALMVAIPEAELFLFDRAQIRFIGLGNMFRYRIRLVHSGNHAGRSARRTAREEANALYEKWKRSQDLVPLYPHEGLDLKPLVTEALEVLFAQAIPEAVLDIENARALMGIVAPDVLLLRASVSAQAHFPLLALAAQSAGIPSVELQHGLEYLGPGSISWAHKAEYVAVYGPLVQKELLALGYDREHLPIVGSPRFDTYSKKLPEARRGGSIFSILVVAPETEAALFSSYDTCTYYEALACVIQEIPSAHVVIKLRPGSDREGFRREAIERAFEGMSYHIALNEIVPDLLAKADVLVTCYSTVILEACLSSVPVVLTAYIPNEREMMGFHFKEYEKKGAVRIAETVLQLKEHLQLLATVPQTRGVQVHAEREFLQEAYAFDGKASLRMKDFIHTLVKDPS